MRRLLVVLVAAGWIVTGCSEQPSPPRSKASETTDTPTRANPVAAAQRWLEAVASVDDRALAEQTGLPFQERGVGAAGSPCQRQLSAAVDLPGLHALALCMRRSRVFAELAAHRGPSVTEAMATTENGPRAWVTVPRKLAGSRVPASAKADFDRIANGASAVLFAPLPSVGASQQLVFAVDDQGATPKIVGVLEADASPP